jgi:hypothetical protein
MDPKACLEAIEERKVSCPARNRIQVIQLVSQSLNKITYLEFQGL